VGKIGAGNDVDKSQTDKDSYTCRQKRDNEDMTPFLLLLDFCIRSRSAAMRAYFRPAADVFAAVLTGHKRPLEAPLPVNIGFRFGWPDNESGTAFMTTKRPGHNWRVFNVLGRVACGAAVFHLFHLNSPFFSNSAILLSPLSDEKFNLESSFANP